MKLLKRNVFWPIVILLIIQLYVRSEVFWVLGLVICLREIVGRKQRFFIPFAEYKQLVLMVLWGGILGFFSLSENLVNTRDIVRDVFYYVNPLIFLFVGASFARKDVNIYRILNAFVIASAIDCFIQYIQIIETFGNGISARSVYDWRKQVGDGHVVTGVALAITMARIVPVDLRIPKLIMTISTIFSLSYFVISMSRTNILILIVLYAVLLLQKGNRKKVFSKIFGLILGVVAVVFLANIVLPKEIANAFTEKMTGSFSEIDSEQSWSSKGMPQSNWRGYETHCALAQWEEESTFRRLFGGGFGTRIFVGEFAYSLLGQVNDDGSAANSIAVLHNGYASQLIKLGLFGVVAYVIFYISLMVKAVRRKKKYDSLESRLLLGVTLIFLMQTYFLNGLFKDYVFLPTVILIGYSAYKIERNKDSLNGVFSLGMHYK